jgi:hypothetical protein
MNLMLAVLCTLGALTTVAMQWLKSTLAVYGSVWCSGPSNHDAVPLGV